MLRHLRHLCTKPFNIRLEPQPPLPELATTPPKTLIRETSKVLRQLMQPHDRPVILTGRKGVGKSTLLMQAVHHARSQERIVLYIPSARDWTHGEGFFAAAAVPGMQPHLDGLKGVRFYDRPTQTGALFKALLEAHGEALKDVPSGMELRDEITKDCPDLYSLLVLGDRLLDDIDSNWRVNPEHAGGVLSQFMEQLCISRIPAAIVIDDYTSMIGMTCMTNEFRKRLHANSIRLIAEHLGRAKIEETAQRLNGPVILAAEERPQFEKWRASRVCGGVDYPIEDDVRQDASGKVWWHDLVKRVNDDGLLVNVPELQSHEQRALCATFAVGRDRANDRLVALAGGRGDTMRRIYATR